MCCVDSVVLLQVLFEGTDGGGDVGGGIGDGVGGGLGDFVAGAVAVGDGDAGHAVVVGGCDVIAAIADEDGGGGCDAFAAEDFGGEEGLVGEGAIELAAVE